MSNEQKFRPYFSAHELTQVIEALKTHQSPKTSWGGIIRYLESFAIKIERGVLNSSLTLKGTPTQQLVRSLDLDRESIREIKTKEGVALHILWMEGETLSPNQLDKVMEYRYDNDLMTPEQERDYEKSLMDLLSGKPGK